jgi:hypothetical protein
VRYSRHAEFTDAVAAEYLARLPTAADLGHALRTRRRPEMLP